LESQKSLQENYRPDDILAIAELRKGLNSLTMKQFKTHLICLKNWLL